MAVKNVKCAHACDSHYHSSDQLEMVQQSGWRLVEPCCPQTMKPISLKINKVYQSFDWLMVLSLFQLLNISTIFLPDKFPLYKFKYKLCFSWLMIEMFLLQVHHSLGSAPAFCMTGLVHTVTHLSSICSPCGNVTIYFWFLESIQFRNRSEKYLSCSLYWRVSKSNSFVFLVLTCFPGPARFSFLGVLMKEQWNAAAASLVCTCT